MLPNEVKNAIPRQKVKYNGTIADVIDIDGEHIWVKVERGGIWAYSFWELKDCEPVPEEPRPFRVGDKVAYELGPNARPDLIGIMQYARIDAVQSDGRVIISGTALRKKEDMPYLRHATNSEVSQYFN